MFMPTLCVRVEKRNFDTCGRIDCDNLIRLVPVTDRTCQPQIRFIIAAAFGERNNMLNLKSGHDQVLWA